MEVEDGIKMYCISVETIYLETSLVRLQTLPNGAEKWEVGPFLHPGPFSQTHFCDQWKNPLLKLKENAGLMHFHMD